MSVKIYTAYKINTGDQSAKCIIDFVRSIRPVLKNIRDTAIRNMWSSKEEYTAAYFTSDDIKKKAGIDFGAQLVFFPCNSDKRCVLAIPFFSISDYHRAFDATNNVTFYGYWNSADPDERCTPKEWRQRKKDWEAVLIGNTMSGIPSQEGLTIDVLQYWPLPMEIKW